MTTDAFWQRVHELLDEHRDPLGDDEVVAFLIQHGHVADEFARLREALDDIRPASLEPVHTTPRPTSRTRQRVAAAAAVVIIALGLGWGLLGWERLGRGPGGRTGSLEPTHAADARLYRFEFSHSDTSHLARMPSGAKTAARWLAPRTPVARQVVAIETTHRVLVAPNHASDSARHPAARQSAARQPAAPQQIRLRLDTFDHRARVVTAKP